MILLELFDKPYPWRRGDPRDLSEKPTNAYFTTDDGSLVAVAIEIQAVPGSGPRVYIAFDRRHISQQRPSYEVTGEGDPYRIFATVAEIIIATAKEHDPTSIGFSADEESRIKLYRRMSPILARKLNMDLTVESAGGDSMYFKFTKKARS
mgnify:CR=1 FL=1